MADRRRHRGPDPRDHESFSETREADLRIACRDLAWLLERGYPPVASLKLVGDRFSLDRRQRKAVERATASTTVCDKRRERRCALGALGQSAVAVDGFNVLIVCESLLAGAPVFSGLDGAHRDLAGVHGTWRRVDETARALDAVADLLGPRKVTWVLDRPVSNSGRLRQKLLEVGEKRGLDWSVEVTDRADPELVERGATAAVATGDGWILDQVPRWVDLPGALAADLSDAWVIDLGARP